MDRTPGLLKANAKQTYSISSQTMNSTQKNRRRGRVIRACDYCRLKRAKCGSLPCSKCAKDGKVCSYSDETRSRQARKLVDGSMQYIQFLENQNRKLSEIVQNLCTSCSVADPALYNNSHFLSVESALTVGLPWDPPATSLYGHFDTVGELDPGNESSLGNESSPRVDAPDHHLTGCLDGTHDQAVFAAYDYNNGSSVSEVVTRYPDIQASQANLLRDPQGWDWSTGTVARDSNGEYGGRYYEPWNARV